MQIDRNTERSRRDLQVVRRKKKGLIQRGGQRRMAPLVVISVILIAATVFAVLLAQVTLAQSGFKMAEMRERMTTAEARHAELVLKVAKLGSSERIERYALGRLGMVYPPEVRYIVADIKPKGVRLAQDVETDMTSTDLGGTGFGSAAP
jgi:cell division protein FtsB